MFCEVKIQYFANRKKEREDADMIIEKKWNNEGRFLFWNQSVKG